MRTDDFIARLRDHIMRNPRPATQDRRERALDVLTAIIAHYDDANDLERNIRAEQAKQFPGFYSLTRRSDRIEYQVDVPDLDAFCKQHRLDKAKLLEVAEGAVYEYKGWVRGVNIHALGKPFKPTRSKETDDAMQRVKKEEDARARFLASQTPYELSPVHQTIQFTPKGQ